MFHGTLVHSRSLTEIEYLTDALLGVDEAGLIAFVERDVSKEDVSKRLKEHGWEAVEVVNLKRGEFLCPG